MKIIQLELVVNGEIYSARSSWGMSAWQRDPLSAISELFGKALPFAHIACLNQALIDPTQPDAPRRFPDPPEFIGTYRDAAEMEKYAATLKEQYGKQADPEPKADSETY